MSFDDLLKEIGMDNVTHALSPEEKFIRNMIEGDRSGAFHSLLYFVRSKIRDLDALRDEGVRMVHRTMRKGVVGEFELSSDDLIRVFVKHYLSECHALWFCPNGPNLDRTEIARLIMETDQMKNVKLHSKG